jgi:stage II sporulation protein D
VRPTDRRRLALARLALALVLVLGLASPVAASGLIRVALVESTRVAEVRGDLEILPLGLNGASGEAAGCVGCPARSWRAGVVRASVNGQAIEIEGSRAQGFRLRSDSPIVVNGREYAGVIDLVRGGDTMAVVNELPLEEYLVGVLRAETPERWPPEALRAQAIAARTYAAYWRMIGAAKPFHIGASTAHQLYAGRVAGSSPLHVAVSETRGQVLRWEGELFPAFYHAESGGYTEDPRSVFAATNMPALKAVRCEFSAGSPHFYWNLDLRLAELTDILRKGGVAVGTVASVEVAERTPSLRASAVIVRGTQGSARLRGNDFRRMVGYERFKSTLFAVAVDGEVARFSGRGYGHGVGMCQWGAKGMAERGYTARQILALYYPGTTLGHLEGR